MLALRPTCENCNKTLTNDAMICTFECTFCADCVEKVVYNVCPNCGGGFEKRPTRPSELLLKYPATKEVVYKPVDPAKFKELRDKNKDIDPANR